MYVCVSYRHTICLSINFKCVRRPVCSVLRRAATTPRKDPPDATIGGPNRFLFVFHFPFSFPPTFFTFYYLPANWFSINIKLAKLKFKRNKQRTKWKERQLFERQKQREREREKE